MAANVQSNALIIAEACFALGFSFDEIAQISGYSPSQVASLSQSPLFISEVENLKNRFASRSALGAAQVLEQEALNAVLALVAIRDNNLNPPAVRVSASREILDRVETTSKQRKLSIQSFNQPVLTEQQFKQLLDFMRDDSLARQAFEEATKLLPEAIEITPENFSFSTPEANSAFSDPSEVFFQEESHIEIEDSSIMKRASEDLSQFLS